MEAVAEAGVDLAKSVVSVRFPPSPAGIGTPDSSAVIATT